MMMDFQITYTDTLEHTSVLFHTQNRDDAVTEYKRLLSTWNHDESDDYIVLEEYDADEFHYETILEHNFWFSPFTLPFLAGLMRGSFLSVVYFHTHYVHQAFQHSILFHP